MSEGGRNDSGSKDASGQSRYTQTRQRQYRAAVPTQSDSTDSEVSHESEVSNPIPKSIIDPSNQLAKISWPQSSPHNQTERELSVIVPQPTLSQITTVYKRRYDRIAGIRFDSSAQRTNAHWHWSGMSEEFKHLQDSVMHLVEKSSGKEGTGSTKNPKKGLAKSCEKLQKDLATIEASMKAGTELMRNLREGDRRTAKAEKALDNASRAMVAAAQREPPVAEDVACSEDLLAPTSPTDESERSVASGPPMEPELASLYDALSQFRSMRERVVNLYNKQQEQLETRQFLQDQDQELDQSEEQFIASWVPILKTAETDLEDATVNFEGARDACIEAKVALPAIYELQILGTKVFEDTAQPPPQTVSPYDRAPNLRLDEANSAEHCEDPPGCTVNLRDEGHLILERSGLPSHEPSRLILVPAESERISEWIQEVSTSVSALMDQTSTDLSDQIPSAPAARPPPKGEHAHPDIRKGRSLTC